MDELGIAQHRSLLLRQWSRDSLLLPLIAAIALLIVLPLGITLGMSFRMEAGSHFAGYREVLGDNDFWYSTWVSLAYTFITVGVQLPLGICAAVLVQRRRRFRTLTTVLFFAPYAIPSIVTVFAWELLLKEHGALAQTSRLLGVPETVWMGEWMFASLCLVSSWAFYPFVFVTVLARLVRIPDNLYRAAEMDGAGFWATFWNVTLPNLRNTLIAVLTLRLVFMFTKFDIPWLMIGKSSHTNLHTVSLYVYEKGLLGAKIQGSMAFAAAVLLGLMVASVVVLFRKRICETE